MARDNGNNQQVYLLVTDENQSTPVQISGEGQAKLLDASERIHLRSKEAEGGTGVNFYNEKGEVEDGVLLTDYHLFVDENNKIFSVPPGSIVQGRFKVTSENAMEKLESNVETPKVETEQDVDIPKLPAEDVSVLQSCSISSSDVYVPMEEIELEEEIVSNEDTGRSSPAPQPTRRDSRNSEVKNQSSEEKRCGHHARGRRRKRSVQETSGKDIKSEPRKARSSLSIHNNQIDQLVEIAEAELLVGDGTNVPDEVASSSCGLSDEFRREGSLTRDRDLLESTEDLEKEPLREMEEHPVESSHPSQAQGNVRDDFTKGCLAEIGDGIIEEASEDLQTDDCGESADSTRAMSEASRATEVTGTEGEVKADETCNRIHDQIPFEASNGSAPADTSNLKDEDIELHAPDHSAECPSSDVGTLATDIAMTDAFERSKAFSAMELDNPEDSHATSSQNESVMDVATAENSPNAESCGMSKGTRLDGSGWVSALNATDPCNGIVQNRIIKTVDREVQVELLTNIKVIRVSHDWQQTNVTTKTETTSREMARQKRELDALSSKLKSMERELEVRMANLRREQSRLEMEKRSFLLEKVKAKRSAASGKEEAKGTEGISRRSDVVVGSMEKNDKVVVQGVGRPKKRKSEAPPPNARASKVARRSTYGRGPKASNDADQKQPT